MTTQTFTQTMPSHKAKQQLITQVGKSLKRNQQGDAELLKCLFKDQIAYDHSEKCWYLWRDHHWDIDKTNDIDQYVSNRVTAEYSDYASIVLQAGDQGTYRAIDERIKQLFTSSRVANVLKLAQSLPGIKLVGNEWDTDPWLLGVQNGVIDLKTGDFRPGDPNNYIRSFSPTEWKGLCEPAPKFLEFINQIFNRDQELINFIQRLLGYSLTGLDHEHILPMFWGEEGRNGKGTLLETIGDVLGDTLTISVPSAVLMKRPHRSSNDAEPFLYQLMGKRLVWTSESDSTDSLNSALIKKLTGGDRINVRTLNAKPITFKPTHTPILLTNDKPDAPSDDQALWERVLLIPFTQRFVNDPQKPHEHKKDPALREKLLNEAPGILAWLVQGCFNWKKEGLNPPQVVLSATNQYRKDQDQISDFIEECCVIATHYNILATSIYQEYKNWCIDFGEPAKNRSDFKKEMEKRKFMQKKTNGGKIHYSGIMLASTPP